MLRLLLPYFSGIAAIYLMIVVLLLYNFGDIISAKIHTEIENAYLIYPPKVCYDVIS